MMRRGLRLKSGAQISTRGGLDVVVPPAAGAVASSVLVSGAGDPDADGTYTMRGTLNGRTYYNLEGEPDNPDNTAVMWNTSNWLILLSDGTVGYASDLGLGVEAPDPWDVPEWLAVDGHEPAPVVTEA